MKHVMIDLETLDTKPGSVILSIGAVAFDFNTEEIDCFHTPINLKSSMNAGFTSSADTILWWMNQSDVARKEVFIDTEISVFSALDLFSIWASNYKDSRIWGNGAAFDNVLLRSAYEKLKLRCPWNFKNDRCYRTLVNMHNFNVGAIEFVGEKHNALDDAKFQVKILRKLNELYSIKG